MIVWRLWEAERKELVELAFCGIIHGFVCQSCRLSFFAQLKSHNALKYVQNSKLFGFVLKKKTPFDETI